MAKNLAAVNPKLRNQKLMVTSADYGHADSLRHAILSQVSEENYTRAIEQLREYLESKDDFPQFRIRSDRYVNYCVDLVHAIKAKRSFPGMQHLAMAKQQELYDRAVEHFEDLKVTLRKLEHIEHEVRLEDKRSTVWVIRALVYSLSAVLLLAFVMEMSRGVLFTLDVVLEDAFSRLVTVIFDKLGI